MTDSIPVWSWRQAITRSGLPSVTRHVLLNLSLYMNEHGEGCFPSMQRMADDTGMSRRSIVNHIGRACEARWIRIEQHGLRGQRWRRNEYVPMFPKGFSLNSKPVSQLEVANGDEKAGKDDVESLEKVVQEIHHLNDKGGAGGSPPCSEGGEPDDIKVVNEVHTNNPLELSNDYHDHDLDEVWISEEEREAHALASEFYRLREIVFGLKPPAKVEAFDVAEAARYLKHPKASRERIAEIWRSRMRGIAQSDGKVPPVVAYLKRNVAEELDKLPAIAKPSGVPKVQKAAPEFVVNDNGEAWDKWENRRAAALKNTIGDAAYKAWICPLVIDVTDLKTAVIGCPSAFHAQRVEQQYLGTLERILNRRVFVKVNDERNEK